MGSEVVFVADLAQVDRGSFIDWKLVGALREAAPMIRRTSEGTSGLSLDRHRRSAGSDASPLDVGRATEGRRFVAASYRMHPIRGDHGAVGLAEQRELARQVVPMTTPSPVVATRVGTSLRSSSVSGCFSVSLAEPVAPSRSRPWNHDVAGRSVDDSRGVSLPRALRSLRHVARRQRRLDFSSWIFWRGVPAPIPSDE
jgi:hypothetical protein